MNPTPPKPTSFVSGASSSLGDTIVAISSAVGPSARMIVRVSGRAALSLAQRLVDGELPRLRRSLPPGLGRVDRPAWLYCFRTPRSYTGEDLLEFHLPGNPLLARMLLEELLRSGARLAEAGEFTARAYFNGRLDLTAAEGVAAAVSASNEQELAAARRLLAGELARSPRPRRRSAWPRRSRWWRRASTFPRRTCRSSAAADRGAGGAGPGSAGEPARKTASDSSGWSTSPASCSPAGPTPARARLLNSLAGAERAVVSPQAGTTRDVIWG